VIFLKKKSDDALTCWQCAEEYTLPGHHDSAHFNLCSNSSLHTLTQQPDIFSLLALFLVDFDLLSRHYYKLTCTLIVLVIQGLHLNTSYFENLSLHISIGTKYQLVLLNLNCDKAYHWLMNFTFNIHSLSSACKASKSNDISKDIGLYYLSSDNIS